MLSANTVAQNPGGSVSPPLFCGHAAAAFAEPRAYRGWLALFRAASSGDEQRRGADAKVRRARCVIHRS